MRGGPSHNVNATQKPCGAMLLRLSRDGGGVRKFRARFQAGAWFWATLSAFYTVAYTVASHCFAHEFEPKDSALLCVLDWLLPSLNPACCKCRLAGDRLPLLAD